MRFTRRCDARRSENQVTRFAPHWAELMRPFRAFTTVSKQINNSTPQQSNTSTIQQSNTSTPQQTTKQFNTSTPQRLNTSTIKHLNNQTPQQSNTSTPQQTNTSTPQQTTKQFNTCDRLMNADKSTRSSYPPSSDAKGSSPFLDFYFNRYVTPPISQKPA